MAFHHDTLRNYTAALIDLFNNLEVQHLDSLGNSQIRNIPIVYSTKEKASLIEGHTAEQLRSGNYNVLPRANLALSTMVKSDQRVQNKNIKIALKSNPDTFDYMWNSVPYEFTYEMSIMCRGMNEASQIVEQIAPKFNPTVNIDIWDAKNLNEPTRVPVRLLDLSIESEEYEEFSSNIITVNVGLSIMGNLYPPIRTITRIKQFKMSVNESYTDNTFTKKIIDNWDVDTAGVLLNQTSTQVQDTTTYPPTIIDITTVTPVIIGVNNLTVIWDDKDNKLTEMLFQWNIIQGTATVQGSLDTAILTSTISETVEVQITITDPFGNFASLSKIYVT